MDIDSNCPYLLPVFGETTSHLTSKLNVMDGRMDGQMGVSIFFNVENSIKREIRKNCFSTKKFNTPPPPPPRNFFFTPILFFFTLEIAWNTKETWNIEKKKFKQHSINNKNYTVHPHDMVHVPAKFRENTSMRFWVTVRKLNVTDR